MKRFAHNTVFSVLAGVAAALGGFLSAVAAARILGTSGAGSVVYWLWIATAMVAVCDLGIGACLTRFLPELTSEGRGDLVGPTIRFLMRPALLAALALPAGLGLAVLAARALAPNDAAWRPDDLGQWALVVALCAAQTLTNFSLSLERGRQRFDRAALALLAAMTTQIVLVAAGAALLGVSGALAGYLAGSAVSAAMLLRAPSGGPALPVALRRRLRRYAVFTWAGSLASLLVWSRIEILFLEHWSGTGAVGLFAVGLTLSSLAVQAPLLFTGGLLAYFSERTQAQGREATAAALALGTRLMAFLLLPLAFGLAALTPEVVPLIYGRGFEAAVNPAALLIAAAGVSSVSAVATNLVYAQERSDIVFYCSLVGGAVSLLGSLLAIPLFGVMGAAISRAVVQLTMLALGFGFVARHLRFRLPLDHLLRLLLAAAVCGICARLCILVLPGPAGLVPAIAVGAVIYLGAVRQLAALPLDDLRQIRAACDLAPRLMRRPVDVVTRLLVRP